MSGCPSCSQMSARKKAAVLGGEVVDEVAAEAGLSEQDTDDAVDPAEADQPDVFDPTRH